MTANKDNAQRSSGPVTQAGKTAVSKNALKHGILSDAVISAAANLKESESEFEGIKRSLVDSLEPVGMLEEMLLDRIAVCYWRLRRVVWSENGAIRLQLDNLWYREKERLMDEAKLHQGLQGITSFWDRMKNSVSAKMAIEQLTDLKKTVEEAGHLPDIAFQEYVALKGLMTNEGMCAFVFHLNQMAEGKTEGADDRQRGKTALIAMMTDDIAKATTIMKTTEAIEEDEISGKQLLMRVPSADTADKLTRYETAIENQLYKAMNQLLKLQTLRKGGKVVSINSVEAESIET